MATRKSEGLKLKERAETARITLATNRSGRLRLLFGEIQAVLDEKSASTGEITPQHYLHAAEDACHGFIWASKTR